VGEEKSVMRVCGERVGGKWTKRSA
jgi:hypothetical protein